MTSIVRATLCGACPRRSATISLLACALALGACSASSYPPSMGPADSAILVVDAGLDAAPPPDREVPTEVVSCSADLEARRIVCSQQVDPQPRAADDEWTTVVTIDLAEGALDGAPRALEGTTDHVVIGFAHTGEEVDTTRLEGLDGSEGHDPMIVGARITQQVHLLRTPFEYGRADVEGTVTVDATGAGHVSLTWSGSMTSHARSGEIDVDLRTRTP